MNKVTSLTEAIEGIRDGSHLALTGFAITRNAMAATHELLRLGRKGLTLTQVIGGMETDLLVGAGRVERLLYSGGSLDRFGPLHSVNRAISSGTVIAEEYSSLSLILRLHAGALGLPYVPGRSMLGSQLVEPLLDTGEVRMGEDPFTGEPVLLLAPLRPDVAVVHADAADEHGNATLAGPTWAIRETAFAARSVIITCEQLVAPGTIPPGAVTIPGAIVSAVALAPRGAYPTAVYQHYDYDRAHLVDYVAHSGEGADGLARYLDEYVYGVANHGGYLPAAASAR